jgi:DNA-binding NtrC family response regulator
MGKEKLSSSDRDFFKLVSRAAFCNPFSDERIDLDLKIADCPSDVSLETRMECVVEKLKERVKKLECAKKADINFYGGEERIILQSAFMFEVFHRFNKQFDGLISDQVKAGDTLCSVSFASEPIGMLQKRGFSSEEAHWLFALLYQLRRAYYFIDQGLIGQSQCMKELRLNLWNNVFTHDLRLYERFLWNHMEDFSTLLLGETGTGKGTAAAAIGRSGFIPYDTDKKYFIESFMSNFISINLSSYSESLIESELFGHEKGSFTGAIGKHQGIFSQCSPHGSILLDEIGDVSLPVQLKLLQLIQERTFSPVGSHDKLRFNGRIIAATNKPLDQLRQVGLFRDDFYYRLCSDCIVVPSLRQRLQENPEEMDDILDFIIARLAGESSKELVGLIRDVIQSSLGADYLWPGNVRELEQAVRRILLSRRYEGDRGISEQDVKGKIFSGIESGTFNAQQLLSSYCALLYNRYGTYEKVSRRINLDRRTVKRYVDISRAEG